MREETLSERRSGSEFGDASRQAQASDGSIQDPLHGCRAHGGQGEPEREDNAPTAGIREL